MQDVVSRDKHFSGRLYVTKQKNKLSPEDFKFVFQIFLESEKLKEIVPDPSPAEVNISYIDSNLAYDLYSFSYLRQKYIIKVSLGDASSLKKEYEILKQIESKNISPKALILDTIESYYNITILVSSFELGLDFKKIENKQRFDFLPEISAVFKSLHSEKSETNEYEDFFNFYESLIDFENNLEEEYIKNLNRDYRFVKSNSIIKNLFTEAKKEFEQLDADFLTVNSLCHTNVQLGTLLKLNDSIKFINFYGAFKINPIFDLVFAILYLGIDENTEKGFIENYLKDNDGVTLEYVQRYIEKCRSIAYKILLGKLIALSYYEKIVYKYDRIKKHIWIYDIYFNVKTLLEKEHPYYVKYIDKSLKFFS